MSVHPYFERLPDRYAAEAVSEVFVPGAYKNNYSRLGTPFRPEDGFPPEPSHLSSVTAAFLERDGKTVRRIALHGISGVDAMPDDADAAEAYDLNVGTFQRCAPLIEDDAEFIGLKEIHPQYGRLGQWAIDATKRSGHRLIAAHLIFKAAYTGRIHSGLSYPTEIKNDFSLLMRHAFEPYAIEIKTNPDGDISPLDELPDTTKEYLEAVMRNDEELTAQAGVPASAVMPPLAYFRQALRMYRKQARKK